MTEEVELNQRHVFVGSSTEGRAVAERVISELHEDALVPLPWYDFFKAGRPPLQELETLTGQADAAIA